MTDGHALGSLRMLCSSTPGGVSPHSVCLLRHFLQVSDGTLKERPKEPVGLMGPSNSPHLICCGSWDMWSHRFRCSTVSHAVSMKGRSMGTCSHTGRHLDTCSRC